MRTTLIVAIVLIVALVALVIPWYPASQQVPQTSGYTSTLQVPTISYAMQTIYTLQSPVTLQPAMPLLSQGQCMNAFAFLIPNSPCSGVYLQSELFHLEYGSALRVDVTDCQTCTMYINELSTGTSIAQLNGTGTTTVTIPAADKYSIEVANFGWSQGVVSSILVTASVPQNMMVTQTITAFSTTTVTSQVAVPAYTILGTLPSVIIFAILIPLMLVCILIGQGILPTSTKHRKVTRRRKSTEK